MVSKTKMELLAEQEEWTDTEWVAERSESEPVAPEKATREKRQVIRGDVDDLQTVDPDILEGLAGRGAGPIFRPLLDRIKTREDLHNVPVFLSAYERSDSATSTASQLNRKFGEEGFRFYTGPHPLGRQVVAVYDK